VNAQEKYAEKQRKKQARQNQEAAKKQTATAVDGVVTEASLVEILKTQASSEETREQRESKRDSVLTRHSGIQVWLAAAIAFATVMQGIFSVGQWDAMRTQNGHIITQNERMSDQNEIMRMEQRGWLRVEEVTIERCRVGEPIKYKIHYNNLGRTPISIASKHYRTVIAPKAIGPSRAVEAARKSNGTPVDFHVPPGIRMHTWLDQGTPITQAEFDGLGDGSLYLWTVVKMEYVDVFGVKRPSLFCFCTDGSGNPEGKVLGYEQNFNEMQ
jgi:hypothetical protein